MDAQAFTDALKAAIVNAEIGRYFTGPPGGLDAAASHYDIAVNVAAVKADQASPGGLKASHAQRRMLQLLIALWRPAVADELFGEGLSALPRGILAMDLRNRALLAELIETYPGWDG